MKSMNINISMSCDSTSDIHIGENQQKYKTEGIKIEDIYTVKLSE